MINLFQVRSTDPRDSVFYDETEHILEDAAGSDLGEKRGTKREREKTEKREKKRHPYYCVVLCDVCVLCAVCCVLQLTQKRLSLPSSPPLLHSPKGTERTARRTVTEPTSAASS